MGNDETALLRLRQKKRNEAACRLGATYSQLQVAIARRGRRRSRRTHPLPTGADTMVLQALVSLVSSPQFVLEKTLPLTAEDTVLDRARAFSTTEH
jgi:hypothetical protein